MGKMNRRNRRGQSIAEYAILFAVVIAAYAAMQVYAKRGLQARVRQGTDALSSMGDMTITSAGDSTVKSTVAAFPNQYEPYYLETVGETYQEKVEQQHMGGGKVIAETVSDVTARAAGATQKQTGATTRATKDKLW